jgi:hypothetical protein
LERLARVHADSAPEKPAAAVPEKSGLLARLFGKGR